MTGGNNVNTKFYSSVKLQMTRRELQKLTPWHRGLDIDIYAPIVDGINLLHEPTYNKKKIDWVDITLTGSTINPYPLKQRDKGDIDEELARLDSAFKILQDGLSSKDNNNLVHEKQPRETLIQHSVPVDIPYLDGENDYLKSKMTNIHEIQTTLRMIRQWENYFARRKSFYSRSEFNPREYKEATRHADGEKMVIMEFGDLP